MDDDAERPPQSFDVLIEQALAGRGVELRGHRLDTGVGEVDRGVLSAVILNTTRPSGVADEPAPSAGSRKIAATTASGRLVVRAAPV